MIFDAILTKKFRPDISSTSIAAVGRVTSNDTSPGHTSETQKFHEKTFKSAVLEPI